MFTGIVEHMGWVVSNDPTRNGRRLVVNSSGWPHRPAPGDSISIGGCCLTVVGDAGEGRIAFDVVAETLSKTTLGTLTAGSRVNLEHAATLSTLLGGHVVQGHVDGVGEVLFNSSSGGDGWRLRVRLDPGLMEYMTPKGSVCIDGVSLTIAMIDRDESTIEIAIIPTTLERTTLGALVAGARANIEADCMAKMVVHWARHYVKA